MIPEFVELCKQVFPSIDPYTAEQAKVAMKQFENVDGNLIRLSTEFDCLQGDIFSEVPFAYIDNEGNVRTTMYKAQLLSNTCDAERSKNLLFAAIRPIERFQDESMINNIQMNNVYSCFYLPDRRMKDEFVDFELVTSISRKAFLDYCSDGLVNRIASLTSVGYYMLITKLAVFLLRPETEEVNPYR